MSQQVFHVLIKRCFLLNKTLYIFSDCQSITPHLIHLRQPFFDNIVDLNVAVQVLQTRYILDVQPEASTLENTKKIYSIVLNDRNMRVWEILDIIKIPTECVRNIFHKHLRMKKFRVRWLPRFVTIDQKQQRVFDLECGLEMFHCNQSLLFHRFVIMNKTRIHLYHSTLLNLIGSLQRD